MFTTAISDQLADSFQELMHEIRAMRRELEGIRAALEEHQRDHVTAPTRPAGTPTRRTRKAA